MTRAVTPAKTLMAELMWRQVIQNSSPSLFSYSASFSMWHTVIILSVKESDTSPSTTSSLKIPSPQQRPAAQAFG